MGRWLVPTAVVVLLGGGAAFQFFRRPVELPAGVTPKQYRDAERRFQESYGRAPRPVDVLSVLGEIAVRDERLETAVACFREIPSDDPRCGPSARLQEAQVLLRLNRAADAERSFRRFLALAQSDNTLPEDHIVTAQRWLRFILSVELRFEERKALLAEMHRRGVANVFDSKQLCFPTLLLWHTSTGRERLAEFLQQDPDNLQLQTAWGRYLTAEGKLNQARDVLTEIRRQQPDDLRCAAALLECCYEADDWDAFRQAAASVPEYARGEPWLLTEMRGQWALHEGRWDDAVNHFRRVLENDAANPSCRMGLSRAYGELGRSEDRRETLQDSLILSKIRVSLVGVTEDDFKPVLELAERCDSVGMSDAVETFRRHAQRIRRTRGGATEDTIP